MRYLPKSDSERREMLDTIGLESEEDLVSYLPADVRFNGELDVPHGKSEYEIVDYFKARAAKTRAATRFLRSGSLQPLPPGAVRYGCFAGRVSYFLHSVSSRDFTGHADHDLRVPDDGLPADRNGRGECFHVRRSIRGARSRHDGRSGHAPRRILVARTVHPEYREVLATY